jgi:hypothetical protein
MSRVEHADEGLQNLMPFELHRSESELSMSLHAQASRHETHHPVPDSPLEPGESPPVSPNGYSPARASPTSVQRPCSESLPDQLTRTLHRSVGSCSMQHVHLGEKCSTSLYHQLVKDCL